jgi:glycosyltransferase involved in cell wall biosynthesis
MHNLTPLEKPYLLCIHIESYCAQDGTRYLDLGWYKDLRLHLRYIKNLRLACPCRLGAPPAGAIAIKGDPLFDRLHFVDLPTTQSWIDAILKLPVTMAKLWKAVGQATYVHAGIAGWVIPYAWLVTPMVLLRPSKFFLIVVESAPWRLLNPTATGFLSRLKSLLFETLGRWCVNHADLAIFTQADYQTSLLTRHPSRGHVIHASWIDADMIVSEPEAVRLWKAKTEALEQTQQTLKIIFAGRVVVDKGVLVLLEAMQHLSEAEIPIELTMIGQGELLDCCRLKSAALQGVTKIRILEAVPYGPEFLQLLQPHHAVVVPSLSDEQPRIVYDAYAQALPVLASHTPGLRDCIRHQDNGMLVSPNDANALADLLQWAFHNRPELERMGMAARLTAQGFTHWTMHQQRWSLLAQSAAH